MHVCMYIYIYIYVYIHIHTYGGNGGTTAPRPPLAGGRTDPPRSRGRPRGILHRLQYMDREKGGKREREKERERKREKERKRERERGRASEAGAFVVLF